MKKDGHLYTFSFALLVCVVCSLTLSAVSEGLRERKELNRAIDIKKNIIQAVGLQQPFSSRAKPEDILALYREKIEELVVDDQGRVVQGKKPGDIQEGASLYPLFIYKEKGAVLAYAFPIQGKGLWSTLYGYLALEADAKTVRGITFYQHGETPGLGGEIEKDWFQNNFKGKSIWDEQKKILVPVKLVKGKVSEKIPPEKAAFYVDGISGATMTSQGVTALLDEELRRYEPFFKSVRKGR